MPLMQNLALVLPSVPLWVKLLALLLLILPNLWCIFQAVTKNFPYQPEKWLWLGIGVMFPVIGGLIFLLFGRGRAIRPERGQRV